MFLSSCILHIISMKSVNEITLQNHITFALPLVFQVFTVISLVIERWHLNFANNFFLRNAFLIEPRLSVAVWKGNEIRTLGRERGWYLDILMVALITRGDARGDDGRDKDDDAPDVLSLLEKAALRAADNGTRSHSLFTYTPMRHRKVRNPLASPGCTWACDYWPYR